jgi:membrane protein DedA with SNARE-associated domain
VLTTVAATLANNPPPELPGFLNVVGGQLSHYGYWAVLLLVLIEDFGIPVPGETILIAAAIFAGAGRLNVVTVGIVGFVAAVLGDNIGFAIGHYGGRALALRWGKYIFLTEERLDRAEVFFNRHGGKIIVVARFIEGLRQANGIIAGISGMHWRRFLFFNAIGAALWVGTWVTIGYTAGNHINTIYHYITTYSYYALIAVVVLVVAFIIRHVLRRRRRSAQRRAPEPQENSEAQTGAGIHEESEAIEEHGTQEDEGVRKAVGTQQVVGTQEADGTQETDGTQEAGVVQEADATQEAGVVQEADTAPNADVTPEAAVIQESAGTPESARSQDGAGMQESAKPKRS